MFYPCQFSPSSVGAPLVTGIGFTCDPHRDTVASYGLAYSTRAHVAIRLLLVAGIGQLR